MELYLLNQIEDLRSLMVSMAERNNLCDPQLVSISQKLDILLNEYYLLCLEEKAS